MRCRALPSFCRALGRANAKSMSTETSSASGAALWAKRNRFPPRAAPISHTYRGGFSDSICMRPRISDSFCSGQNILLRTARYSARESLQPAASATSARAIFPSHHQRSSRLTGPGATAYAVFRIVLLINALPSNVNPLGRAARASAKDPNGTLSNGRCNTRLPLLPGNFAGMEGAARGEGVRVLSDDQSRALGGGPGDDEASLGRLMKRLAGPQTRYVNALERRRASARPVLSD
jgi:hypothetical protein